MALSRNVTWVPLAVVAGAAVFVYPWVIGGGATADLDVLGGLHGGRFATALGLIFAGGVLTAMTPCVFPLIPITMAVFGAKGGNTRGRNFALSASYTLGMAALFSTLGVLAVLSDKVLGHALGNPWVVSLVALLLFALALSMFGLYEIRIPSALANRLHGVGGVGLAGAFLMGLVAGILAAPCTGPVLSAVLLYVANTRSVPVGAGLLFVYALGVGTPFLVLALFSMKLPKSGAWMEAVKSILGLALVTLALAYVRDAFPALRAALGVVAANRWVALGGAAAVALGVVLGAVDRSFHGSARERALKFLGTTLVVVGLMCRMAATNVASSLDWRTDLEAALRDATTENKPVLVDFFAEWCEACKDLDRKTYPDARVRAETRRFVVVKVDATNDDGALEGVYARFGVQALPTVAFVDSRGQVLASPKITEFVEPDELVQILRQVK